MTDSYFISCQKITYKLLFLVDNNECLVSYYNKNVGCKQGLYELMDYTWNIWRKFCAKHESSYALKCVKHALESLSRISQIKVAKSQKVW